MITLTSSHSDDQITVTAPGTVTGNGTSSPSVTLSEGETEFSWTITAADYGERTVTFTNDEGMPNPAPVTYEALIPYTFRVRAYDANGKPGRARTVTGGRRGPAPVLLVTVDLSGVAPGAAVAVPVTIEQGRRYILEVDGLTYSVVNDYDGCSYSDNAGYIAERGVQFRPEPQGGRPTRMALYTHAVVGFTLANDLFTVPAGEAINVAAEWGMNTQYMELNGSPVYVQEGTGNPSRTSYATDPAGMTHFKLPLAATAQTLRVYERPNIRQIVLLGDSMTAAVEFDSGVRLASNRNRNWINHAHGGRTLEDILAAITADVQPFYQSSAVSNTVVLRAGVNNLAPNGQAADMLSVVQAIVDTIKSFNSGWNVDLCTITPFNNFYSNGATQESTEAQRQAYNAGLASITGIRRVLDVGGTPQLQDPSDLTYYVDKLHCTDAGYGLIADYLAARL